MIDDDQVVWQKQVQIGPVFAARVTQLERLKLEYQVVAQRPVKPQVIFAFGSHLRH